MNDSGSKPPPTETEQRRRRREERARRQEWDAYRLSAAELVHSLELQQRASSRAKQLLAGLSAALSVLLGAGTVFFAYPPTRIQKGPPVAPIPAPTIDSAEVRTMRHEIGVLGTRIKALSEQPPPPPESKMAAQLSEIQTSLDDTRSRLQKLEAVILADPSKALEIHLLKRDLESLRAVQQANMDAVKDGADRLYDILKWLLGATAVAILSLATTTFLKGGLAKPEPKSDPE